MSDLFKKTVINGMEISNRFIRSATWEGMATDRGKATQRLVRTMADLAEGGVGLIISGHAYVREEGQASFRQLGVYNDEIVEGLERVTESVHARGGKIVMQITHAGTLAAENLSGMTPSAISVFEGLADTPRNELDRADIGDLVTSFSEAALRAKRAGFDGVQVHSAHGYLLSQFLSPHFNRRDDEYGGDIKNRTRIHCEIIRAIREKIGKNFPVLIKMNCRDQFENGLEAEDSIIAAKIFKEEGFDAIELSGGSVMESKTGMTSPCRPGINSIEKEAYFLEEARQFRKEIDLPLMLVGGFRSFEVAERVVKEGVADYISMCRPFIREPSLVKRWESGDLRKSECVSDNLCFRPGIRGEGIYCLTEKREKMKAGASDDG